MSKHLLFTGSISLLIALSTSGCVADLLAPSAAVPYTNKPFMARYEQDQGQAKSSTLVSSNGKGKLVVEAESQIFLHDYIGGKNYLMYPVQKVALWTPLRESNGWLYDREWLKSLGDVQRVPENKKIEGRECEGFIKTSKEDQTKTELWFDAGDGCLMSGQCTNDKGIVWTTKALEFHNDATTEDVFRVPANYIIRPFAEEEARQAS